MFKRILKYLLAVAIVCYASFALFVIPSKEKSGICQGVLINVDDNGMEIISRDEVMDIIKKEGLDPSGKEIGEFYCSDIENFVDSISLVDKSQVYKSIKGYTVIDIDCRIPIVKVYDNENRSYYIDEKGNRIKSIESAIYLPIASGEIKNEETIRGLIKIAQHLDDNRFWREQTEQIHVTPRQEIILIPRVGNHLIELGKADNIEDKLAKLKEFYERGLNKIGWNKYDRLNIEFDKQVICTKKE